MYIKGNMEDRKRLEKDLDSEKESLRKYDALQEEIGRLNASINKCLEIVNSSATGVTVKSKIEDFMIMNDKANKATNDSINRCIESSEKSIKSINERISEMKKDTN